MALTFGMTSTQETAANVGLGGMTLTQEKEVIVLLIALLAVTWFAVVYLSGVSSLKHTRGGMPSFFLNIVFAMGIVIFVGAIILHH